MIYLIAIRSPNRDVDAIVLAGLSEFGALRRALPGVWLFSSAVDLAVITNALHNRSNGEAFFVATELVPDSWAGFMPEADKIDEWLSWQLSAGRGAMDPALRQAAARRLAAAYLEKKQKG